MLHPITQEVLARLVSTPSDRLREVMSAIVRHLHAFVVETGLTEQEWQAGIEFFTRTGQMCDDRRQEFVLLSDILGISMLTIDLNRPSGNGVTASTVLGPFFAADAPHVPLGGDIANGAPGTPCWVSGTVRSSNGSVAAGARLDVWESDDDGLYDVQYGDGRVTGRGHLFADEQGAYRFWCVKPCAYPIPDDGPVGDLLRATDRSPMRPAHLHFRVAAQGHHEVVTHIFPAGTDHLSTDAVFGVRDSLIVEFSEETGGIAPDGTSMNCEWSKVEFDIVLAQRS
jgi:hydroxyquinol 1,2-dioxygenase